MSEGPSPENQTPPSNLPFLEKDMHPSFSRQTLEKRNQAAVGIMTPDQKAEYDVQVRETESTDKGEDWLAKRVAMEQQVPPAETPHTPTLEPKEIAVMGIPMEVRQPIEPPKPDSPKAEVPPPAPVEPKAPDEVGSPIPATETKEAPEIKHDLVIRQKDQTM